MRKLQETAVYLVCLIAAASMPLGAQELLPGAGPPQPAPPVQVVPPPPGPPPQPPEPELPRDARPGVFQKLLFDDAYLPRNGDAGYGNEDVQLRAVFGLPCPTPTSPLLITPGVAAHFLDGPAGTDLPPRVYDIYTQFRWMSQVSPRLGLDLGVAPGLATDFQQSSSQAVRVTGHAASAWTLSPETKLILGATYLDRRDVPALPIAGLVWKPNADTNFELVFPRPKLAHRLFLGGVVSDEVQDWLYLAGELGGGTWAIRRAGDDDVFSYRDYRVLLGVEHKVLHAISSRLEVGYVFGRRISFDSGAPDFTPHDAVVLRGGLTY